MSKMYGWYSAKQAEVLERQNNIALSEKSGQSVYETIDGREVIVTDVTSEPDHAYGNWDDYVFLGELIRFLRFVEN